MNRFLQVAAIATVAGLLSATPSFAGGITGGVRNEFGNNYNKTVRNLHVTGSSSVDLTKVSNLEFCGTEFSTKSFKDFTANDFSAKSRGGKLFVDGSVTISSGTTESALSVHGREQTNLVQKQNERYSGTESSVEGGNSNYHEASSFSQSVF